MPRFAIPKPLRRGLGPESRRTTVNFQRGSSSAAGGQSLPACTIRPLAALLIAIVLAAPAKGLDPQKSISQFTHTSWTAKDGIPGPVRAIVQTPDGYLWLGSEAGLYRFDGIRFVLWEPSFGEQLPSDSVWSLCTARDGSLWIGFGSSGIGQLRAGRLTIYSPKAGVPGGGVLSIVEDQNGAIWAGGEYGLSEFEQGRWHRVGAEVGYPASGAQTLLVDRRGNLWAATDGLNSGLSRDPVQRNTIFTLSPNAKRFVGTGVAVGYIRAIVEDPDGGVWIVDTTSHTPRQITPRSGLQAGIAAGAGSMCMLFDRDKSLWVELIGQGIGRIPDFKHAKNVPLNRFGPKDGLSGGTVYSIYEDREGDVWFGTGGGLDRFRENKVTSYSAQEGLDPDQEIGLTSTQDGSVWIISYTRDAVRRFHDGRFLTSKLPPYSPTDTTRILSLYAEGANSVWVGGNFKLAEGIDGKFSYRYAAEIVDGANVEGVAKGADGSLWITQTRWVPEAGADSIGNILRLRNGQWTDLRQQFEFPRFRCRVVYADLQGRLWLGFENGDVAVYDSGNVRVYSTIDGLPDGRVLAISADRAGNIWVGGEGGLSELQKGHFVTLSKSNGLPGRAVSGVVEDEDGFLWLAGSLGILRVDPKELEKAVGAPSYRMQGIRFDASDGLRGLPRQHEPFPHATRAVDGRLWFATMGGVAVIDPRHWPRNSLIPPVVIEDVAADDRNYSAYSGLKLKPNIRNLEFQFTALSLMDPARVEFRYKLEGYDRDWRGPVNAREAKYTNLPPRNYRFRVIACNNDGVWNNVGATLDFSIAPAYYQTPWFLLTCMAVFLALLWALYQYRLRQVAQEFNRDLEARVSERTRIARDLHDTLLQSFQGLMLRFQTVNEMLPTRALEAKKALEGALDRADKALVEGRDAIKDMRTSTLVDYDLAQSMTALMTDLHEELATGNRDAVTFRVLVEGTPRTVAPTLRDEIYRIARESLRNAFRHAHARHIETEITYSEPLLRVRFRDDGTGIDPHVLEHGGRSGHWGLPGMRERANLIGAQLDVWSKPRAGTEVDLSIPGSIAYEEFPSRPGFRLFRNRKERNHENRS